MSTGWVTRLIMRSWCQSVDVDRGRAVVEGRWRVLAAMDSAHHLELTITGQTIVTGVREPPITAGHFAGLADLLRDLVYVRDSLGIPLLVPGILSGADQVAVRKAQRGTARHRTG